MTRVLVASLYHETHCFADDITGPDQFTRVSGDAFFRRRGDGSMSCGFLEVADAAGWEVVPTAFWSATPSGTVADSVPEGFWAEVEPMARKAAREGIDAVFLLLHGAMISQSEPDVEGALLARLRAVPGLEAVPVFGPFDLHATLTRRMIALSDGLVCYRENPHTDARETAVRAARLLERCLATGQRPRGYGRNAAILWPPTGTGTADSPMRDLEALAREIEAGDPDIWAVNVVGGYSFADAPEAGVAFSVLSTGPAEAAEAAVDRLVARAQALRAAGIPAEMTPEEALDRIAADPPAGPAILVEPSDNIGGGAPGDGTGLLRAFLARGVRNAGVIINDPAAAAALAGLAPGATRRLAIGGKGSRFDAGPVELEVTLVSISDGRFDLEDIQSHMAAMGGRHVDMGPCAVVRHEGLTILLTSRKTAPFDLGQWRSQGVNPEAFAVIAVKAAVAHRRAYDRIAADSFTVATPGPCISDPRALPYTRVARPVYPLDP